jgi:hypothetical protein
MKKLITLCITILLVVFACDTKKSLPSTQDQTAKTLGDTVRIANEELEYEVIIIDPGFSSWMLTNARPRGHYTQQYMEMRNRTWVNEWNNRTRIPQYANIFQMPIDYNAATNYGYEVNYLLYNYLTYFQIKNNIRLGGFNPRI